MAKDLNDVLQVEGSEAVKDFVEDAAQKALDAKKTASEKPNTAKSNSGRINIDAQIEQARADLDSAEKKLADFVTQKDSALEYLKSIDKFDSDTVFSCATIEAAAFAKIFLPSVFSAFVQGVKEFNSAHKVDKSVVHLPSFNSTVADKRKDIAARHAELKGAVEKLQAQLRTLKFQKNNPALAGLTIPKDFFISEDGVYQDSPKGGMIQISRAPVMVAEQFFGVDTSFYQWQLSYKVNSRWQLCPPVEQRVVADARKILELTNYGLPVNSRNAVPLVDYLDAFIDENRGKFPVTCTYENCGWKKFGDTEFFLDPRRDCTIDFEGAKRPVVCTSQSQFSKALIETGDFKIWRRICREVRNYPAARLMLAAAVAAPLLKILNKRNFLLHVYAKTTAGKTTALKFAASAIGNIEGVVKNFNATANGLQGAAAEYSDYCLPVDEWQSAGANFRENVGRLIHVVIDGTARTKMNKDSTLRCNENWRVIVVTTGEVPILKDSAKGGEHTRVLNIAAPAPILQKDLCKKIHDTISDNYGFALPRVIDFIERVIKVDGKEKIAQWYATFEEKISADFPTLLDEHCRYLALLAVADFIFSVAIFGDDSQSAVSSAVDMIQEVAQFVPNKDEVADTPREIAMVLDFINGNPKNFMTNTNTNTVKMQEFWGALDDDDYVYLTIPALKKACTDSNFDYAKVVADLAEDGFFVPADKVEKGRKTPRPTVQLTRGDLHPRCYRIPRERFDSGE